MPRTFSSIFAYIRPHSSSSSTSSSSSSSSSTDPKDYNTTTANHYHIHKTSSSSSGSGGKRHYQGSTATDMSRPFLPSHYHEGEAKAVRAGFIMLPQKLEKKQKRKSGGAGSFMEW